MAQAALHTRIAGLVQAGRRWRLAPLILAELALLALAGFWAARPAFRQNAEIRAIRRLAAVADWTALANRLDGSMVLIPAGVFILGSDAGPPQGQPARRIYLDGYWIDRFEVTNAQYGRFVQAGGGSPPIYWPGANFPPGQADYPVAGVSWIDAQAYCAWAGKRLPTEAEWEKACRGPLGALYPWGNRWDPGRANLGLPQAANWPLSYEEGWQLILKAGADPTQPAPQPVGSCSSGASPYGVLDLTGNVSEWVADWYNWDGYWEWPDRNPAGRGPPWNHSVRGSGWFDRRGQAEQVEALSRCAARNSSHSDDDPRLGFRCARSLP